MQLETSVSLLFLGKMLKMTNNYLYFEFQNIQSNLWHVFEIYDLSFSFRKLSLENLEVTLKRLGFYEIISYKESWQHLKNARQQSNSHGFYHSYYYRH